MKAIIYDRYGGPEVLKYRDVQDPRPTPGEALVAVHCASVIPGDWKVRSGLLHKMFPQEFPTTPGRDGAGVVVATGTECDWATIGDEICFVTRHTEPGSYAELVSRPQKMTVPKPNGIDFAQAAAMIHAGVCAWIALIETAAIKEQQRVLVHAGAGAIGGMAIQIATHRGCEVTATCSAMNADYVRGLGAHHIVAYDSTKFDDVVSGQDVVLDLIGGEVHERSCRVLKQKGILVWLIAQPFNDVSKMYGVSCKQVHIHERREALESVARLVSKGVLRPQVSRRMHLSKAADAHRMLERGKNSRGRIVLEINGRT